MFPKDEFMKYATQHLGMSSMHLERYADKSTQAMPPNIQGFTPNVIEERQMNIVGLDVFSRLMMERHPGTDAVPGVD
jgi:ATP-dependent Clp protease, protease subunit